MQTRRVIQHEMNHVERLGYLKAVGRMDPNQSDRVRFSLVHCILHPMMDSHEIHVID